MHFIYGYEIYYHCVVQMWERKIWASKFQSLTEITVRKPGLGRPQFVFHLHEPHQETLVFGYMLVELSQIRVSGHFEVYLKRYSRHLLCVWLNSQFAQSHKVNVKHFVLQMTKKNRSQDLWVYLLVIT